MPGALDDRENGIGFSRVSGKDWDSCFTQAGRVDWIGVRHRRGQPVATPAQVEALEGRGLEHDHASARRGGRRQVTLIQAEHLPIIGEFTEKSPKPELLRRNFVISGINLQALVGNAFQIGEAVFKATGLCPPCRQMEEALGAGGRTAMEGMGGITAQVLRGGLIRVGDEIRFYNSRTQQELSI